VPVPRRFDRRPPERDQTRINDRIRVPEVRLIGEDGQQIGVMKTPDALKYAEERDLDLVEVAPEARPPVCRVLDYSKFKYEQAQKLKAARKHQQQITIREIKFRPKIALNDYETKKGHVARFLKSKDKVKITIMFRGREQSHPERGTALLEKLATELGEIAVVEQTPLQDGRNMTMMLAPSRAILAAGEEHHEAETNGDGKPAKKQHKHDEHAAEHAAEEAAASSPEPAAEEAAASSPEPAAEEAAAPEPAAEEEEAPAPSPEPASVGAAAPSSPAPSSDEPAEAPKASK
jgi:translation initiation factor IF-3